MMSSTEALPRKHSLEEDDGPRRKKFKTSDLPLSATIRSAIDGLVHIIKKKGEFDKLRKTAWAKVEESVSEGTNILHLCLSLRCSPS